MKKYCVGMVVGVVLTIVSASAMRGDYLVPDSDELNGSMRALNLDEGYARSIRMGGTCSSIDHNIPENLEDCSSLEVKTGNLTQTGVLDYLWEKLQRFPTLRKIRIAIADASGDVVRNLMVRAGTIGVDAGLPEDVIKNAMRLGLSEAEIQQIAKEEDAGASFAPILQMEVLQVAVPQTLNWGVPGDIQKVLYYLGTLLGGAEAQAAEDADFLMAHPELVVQAMADAGFDPATGARQDEV